MPAPGRYASGDGVSKHAAPVARWPLAVLASVVVLLHLAIDWWSPYGVHRDELLYLAMGRHLRLWAMDFPPGIAITAELTRTLVGNSALVDGTVVLRATPALAAGALVLLAGVTAHALGGGRRAQLLAAFTVVASPLFMRSGTLFQPVVFDQLWWTLGLLALVRLERDVVLAPRPVGDEARRAAGRALLADWALLGAATGVGLLFKFSIAFFAVGALVGLILVLGRRGVALALRTPGPWLALALTAALGAPSVVGQVALGWPVRGQMRDLRASQLVHVGPLDFVFGQLQLGPAVVLAALGVWALLRPERSRDGAPPTGGRAAGVACVVAFLMLLVLRGKSYYIGPIYPTLWAAGSVLLARRPAWGNRTLVSRLTHAPRARVAAAALLVGAYGLLALPLGVPVLPPEPMARYAAALGGAGTSTNQGNHLALPQDYADMLGWPELAAAVAQVWHALPAEQRTNAALLAANYGEAGALELYGPSVGLPPPISAAGSWWFFGPGERAGSPLLTVGVPADSLRALCAAVRPLGTVRHAWTPWVVEEERDVPLVLCEGPRQTVQEIWPSLAGRN